MSCPLTVLAIAAAWLPLLFGQAGNAAPPAVREISVAAASDLRFALDELSAAFEHRHPGISIKPSYGSSGNLFAMIHSGARFDLFLSADVEYAQKLGEAGFGADTNVFLYALGRMVVWVPAHSPVQVHSMQALLHPSVRKIAIPNPRHAPYGRAAEAAMKSLKVYEAVRTKLVFGENVSQAIQFVQSGAADIGVVALSLVSSPTSTQGRYWEVPPGAYPPIKQGGLLLKSSASIEAGRAFRDFMSSESGSVILKRNGFVVPGRE